MNGLILIIDDDSSFIKELRKQAETTADWLSKCLILSLGENDFWEQITQHRSDIIAAFLDYDLSSNDDRGAVKDFMRHSKDYLDWDDIRVFWFSGDDHLTEDIIREAKSKFPTLETKHLRKPFDLKAIFARLEKFELAEQWQNFPAPLRVLNREGSVIYSNIHWQAAANQPDPSLFIKPTINSISKKPAQASFKTGDFSFFERPPNGVTEPSDFRLHSFLDDTGHYLIQYAEVMDNQASNDWKMLIAKIAKALVGHGYTRVRLYRYYNVPEYYDIKDEKDEQCVERGVMDLCFTSTDLNMGVTSGIQGIPLRKHLSGDLSERIKRSKSLYEDRLKTHQINDIELIYHIITQYEDSGWDQIIRPPNAKEYCVVELPLFTYDDRIKGITNTRLIGKLAFDCYDNSNNQFHDISDNVIETKLGATLLSYCKALSKALKHEILNTHTKTLALYADIDRTFDFEAQLSTLEETRILLRELLKKAIDDLNADVGYITEAHPQGYQIAVATKDHQLFENCIFSKTANDLTVVRCWQDQHLKALPDINEVGKDIMQKIRQTYQDDKLVWNEQDPEWDRSACNDYLTNEVQSLIALPVLAGKEVIAAIILHSKNANHFDHERLDKLRNLVSRVAWMLMVTQQTKQRQLLLDGIYHEIKSDIIPLKQALKSLPVSNHTLSAWKRSVYCSTRLEMAVKNLLLMTRGGSKAFKNESAELFTILSNLVDCYQPDMKDRQQSLVIEPPLNSPDLCSPWHIRLSMSMEWLTHVMVNLFDNAVKYGKRGEKIQIQASCDSDQFILCIQNTGTLPPEKASRVFIPSYQSEQGTGFHVGLASCKLVMEKHGGTIQLKQKTDSPPLVLATLTWSIIRSL